MFFIFSCAGLSQRDRAIETSSRIIKSLCQNDSISVINFFLKNPAIHKSHTNNRGQRISDALSLSRSFRPVSSSEYIVRIDTLGGNVFDYNIEVPFKDSITKELKGEIVIRYANYFGFEKAEDIHVTNFDEIEKQRKEKKVPE